MRRYQSGMSFLGFILVAAVVGCILLIVMKLFPMYQEFWAVKSTLKGMAAESDISAQGPDQLRDRFFKRMFINNSETVKHENITFENTGNGQVMHVNYEVRVPMVYNLDVVGKFEASQDFGKAAAN